MRLTPFLTQTQVERIHHASLRVLEEVGVKVEHDEVRHLLTAVGGRITGPDIVRFAPTDVEHALSLSPRRPSEPPQPPRIRGSVGVYECRYLLSPLRLARLECEQLLFFRRQQLRMWIGHMPLQGGTAPVSFAGATVLALAEQLFLYLLTSALWGEATLSLSACVPVLDMRSLAACYGRPEEQRINAVFACLADFYGCSVGGHTGGTDAKVPSVQAGVQKVLGALFTALATGYGQVSAGMLSMDELCSPVQMVLDDDIVEALNVLISDGQVDEEECAFEEIRSVGHGGDHVGTDYTARRFRECLWQPRTWSSGLLNQWERSGGTTDIDRARQIVAEFNRRFQPMYCVSADEERDLRQIIRLAAATMA